MVEKNSKLNRLWWIPGVLIILFCFLWVLSIFGLFPLTYSVAKTPAALNEFLVSPRDDMRGIKVNRHFLEIGKRPSMQILKGYDEHMYLVRPYRGTSLRPRNMTKPEVMDRCITLSGQELEDFRAKLDTSMDLKSDWEGAVEGNPIKIFKAGDFNYIVIGLNIKPIFIAQLELAKRLGMEENVILSRIIPVQNRWYQNLLSSPAMEAGFPISSTQAEKDELFDWLDEHKR